MAYLLPRLKEFDTRALELLYELGAFSYAGMCGIIAAADADVRRCHSSVQTLTVGIRDRLRRGDRRAQCRAPGDRHRPAAAGDRAGDRRLRDRRPRPRTTSSAVSLALLHAGDDLDHAQRLPGPARLDRRGRDQRAPGREDAGPRPHRRGHRPAQPRRPQPPPGRAAAAARPGRASSRCSGSTSTGSRKSTTRSATRSATSCSPKSPAG